MLKTKRLTIIFTFFVIISLFGTTSGTFTAFAQSESASSSAPPPAPPAPSAEPAVSSDLPQYNLYDTDKLYSESVFMVNLNTNIVVCSKNPDEKMIPASIAKIMTALVCFEKITDFTQVVECPYACFNEFWEDNPNFQGASTAGIATKQDNLTYKDCLYALMLASGCEASNIIAYNVAGDIPTFVDMMNETAQKIGCKNTHFTNAHGLYEKENYTSAKDMYLITRYAIDTYPEFKKICETVSYDMPSNKSNPSGYTVYHTNQMMKTNTNYYYEGVKGVKTGSIHEYFEYNSETKKWEKVKSKGVRTLVTICEKDNFSYLLVTLGAPYYDEDGKAPKQQYPYVDHKNLYDWAFSEFEYARVIQKNELIMNAPVDMGEDTDEIGLVTNGEYFTLLPKMEGAQSIVQTIKPTVEMMTAPIEKGTYVADMQLVMGNEVVATIPLITERYVAVDQSELYRRRIEGIIKSPQFIIAAAAVAALIIAIIVIKIVIKNKKKEQRRRRRVAVSSSSRSGRPSSPKNNRR